MPQAIHPATGSPVYVPGVYTAQDVVSDLPGALPEFHVPIVAGSADEGIPYNAAALAYSSEIAPSPFVFHGTSSTARRYWGPASDIGKGWLYAKRHGLPSAYGVCIGLLTRASVLASSAGPIVQTRLYAQKYGAPGGYIKIKSAGGAALEVVPLANFAMLSENLGAADTRAYVKDVSWVKDGQTITLGDNTTTNTTKTVVASGYEVNATGQLDYWIDLDSAVGGGGLDVADYALVCEYDENAVESSPTFTTGQGLVDWCNDTSAFIGADKQGTFTDALLIALGTSTAIKDVAAWSTAAGGDSPAATTANWDSFIAYMDVSGWDDFGLRYQKFPQAFLALDPSTVVHASLRDYATARRAAGFPISVTTGCDWGDHVFAAGNSTDPVWRAGQLNSQDVAVIAGGIDRLAAYLSHAAAVFGRRISGGLGHNLTNDTLLYETIERRWDEITAAELTQLHRAGVVTYRLSTSGNLIRFVLSQGLNTLQNNDLAWNALTEDTPLLMQRDLADYIDKIMRAELDGSQIGADTVDPAGIAAVMRRRGEQMERRGLVKRNGFSIVSIALNAQATGYDVSWSVRLPTTNDFIALTTQILVGGDE